MHLTTPTILYTLFHNRRYQQIIIEQVKADISSNLEPCSAASFVCNHHVRALYNISPGNDGASDIGSILPMAAGEIFTVLSQPDELGLFLARARNGAEGFLLTNVCKPLMPVERGDGRKADTSSTSSQNHRLIGSRTPSPLGSGIIVAPSSITTSAAHSTDNESIGRDKSLNGTSNNNNANPSNSVTTSNPTQTPIRRSARPRILPTPNTQNRVLVQGQLARIRRGNRTRSGQNEIEEDVPVVRFADDEENREIYTKGGERQDDISNEVKLRPHIEKGVLRGRSSSGHSISSPSVEAALLSPYLAVSPPSRNLSTPLNGISTIALTSSQKLPQSHPNTATREQERSNEKTLRKRLEAVAELVETEENFLKDLWVIKQVRLHSNICGISMKRKV